jgi:carbon monoxide dehydrogenase subunit G
MRVRGSVLIQRDTSDVFRFVSDPSKDLSWRSHLVSSTAVDAELAVGSVVRQTYSYQGHTVEAELEVTDLRPPETIDYRLRGQIRARINFTCAAEAAGTRFSMSGTYELSGPASLFEGRIQRELDEAVVADLKRLKAVLESPTSP